MMKWLFSAKIWKMNEKQKSKTTTFPMVQLGEKESMKGQREWMKG